ncbi:MAG: helix-turn-helix domain-containing protein [Pseudomonadota bacterium]
MTVRVSSKRAEGAKTDAGVPSESASADAVELTERQKEIATVARVLIATEGYAALSMRRVASELGIKLASLQYHVPTKRELVHLAVAYLSLQYREGLEQMISTAETDPRGALRRVLQALLSDDEGEDTVYRFEIQFRALAAIDESVSPLYERFCASYSTNITRFVGMIRPDLTSAESAIRADLVIALIEGVSMVVDAERSERIPRKRYLKRALSLAEEIILD